MRPFQTTSSFAIEKCGTEECLVKALQSPPAPCADGAPTASVPFRSRRKTKRGSQWNGKVAKPACGRSKTTVKAPHEGLRKKCRKAKEQRKQGAKTFPVCPKRNNLAVQEEQKHLLPVNAAHKPTIIGSDDHNQNCGDLQNSNDAETSTTLQSSSHPVATQTTRQKPQPTFGFVLGQNERQAEFRKLSCLLRRFLIQASPSNQQAGRPPMTVKLFVPPTSPAAQPLRCEATLSLLADTLAMRLSPSTEQAISSGWLSSVWSFTPKSGQPSAMTFPLSEVLSIHKLEDQHANDAEAVDTTGALLSAKAANSSAIIKLSSSLTPMADGAMRPGAFQRRCSAGNLGGELEGQSAGGAEEHNAISLQATWARWRRSSFSEGVSSLLPWSPAVPSGKVSEKSQYCRAATTGGAVHEANTADAIATEAAPRFTASLQSTLATNGVACNVKSRIPEVASPTSPVAPLPRFLVLSFKDEQDCENLVTAVRILSMLATSRKHACLVDK
eukprot:GHVT01032741.1.p1 GENE.GHVT01032741.1~~GHVT01032741.1.p1  ORF type:complete len:499 (-),score=62.32 GHVT01032741.1:301-1797(-)